MELLWIERTSPFYEEHLTLRYEVLRAPLGMGRDSVGFPGEDESGHLVAISYGRVIGCVVLTRQTTDVAKLRAMAVAPTMQRGGVGQRLVAELEARAKSDGVKEVVLHAREHAIPFYERLGYRAFGETFIEVTIPHRAMRKRLIAE